MIRKQTVKPLETDRLYLRMWKRSDAPQLFAYASNPSVGPRAGWKPHESVAESRKIIETVFRESRVWAIIEKASGRIIGSIGFSEDRFRPGVRSLELGYSLAEEYWGRGLMTEAARRVIAYGFEYIGLDVMMIRTGEENLASQRIIEKEPCGGSTGSTTARSNRSAAIRCCGKNTTASARRECCNDFCKESCGGFAERKGERYGKEKRQTSA